MTELVERLAAQLASRPDAPAVADDAGQWSYRELSQAAERLADALTAAGVGPGALVAVTAHRRRETVAAIWAAFLCRAAYLPLEPDLPPARHDLLLDDSGAAALVDGQQVTALAGRSALPGAAYVIYTSGSTGQPKGVVVSAQALALYVDDAVSLLGLAPGERFALLSTLAADLGHTALYPALASGGCVEIVDAEVALDPSALAQLFTARGIDSVKIVPSHLSALLEAGQAGLLPRRRLVLGGERLSWALVERVQALDPQLRVFNHYGPTESTVGVSAYAVPPLGERLPTASVPIGRALPSARLAVLDEAGAPVGPGQEGELYIGGPRLADGYLNHPDLTAERFVVADLGTGPERAYKSGDRVRRLADGLIEFLGRADDQVKIRGFRVEPAELEAALKAQPQVQQAAVLVEGDEGAKQLVAYLTPALDDAQLAALAAAIKERLPEQLLPARTVSLDALPLTPNGKLDRVRLAALAAPPAPVASAGGFTPDEAELAALWRTLGLAPEHPADSFLALGGDSLTAIRLLARLQARGVKAGPDELLRRPTLAAQAELLRSDQASAAGAPTGPASGAAPGATAPVGTHAELEQGPEEGPLSEAQEGLWFLSRYEPGPGYNVSLALELVGPLDLSRLEAALACLVARHPSLRLRVAAAGEPHWQAAAPSPLVARACTDEREARAWLEAESLRPFALDEEAPVRLALATLGDGRRLLLLSFHHIAVDAWSTDQLRRELVALYAGEELAPPAYCFSDYARWQRAQPSVVAKAERLAQALGGAPETIELYQDRPAGGPGESQTVARLRLPLDDKVLAGLDQVAQTAGATRFMALLAGTGALLGRLSGQSEVVVGTPLAGRPLAELGEVVGFFSDAMPVRLELDGRSLTELVAAAREQVLSLLAAQEVPFTALVAALNPQRLPGRHPLFQVVVQTEPERSEMAAGGVSFRPFDLEVAGSKFDLVFCFERGGQELRLDYDPALYDQETARYLGQRLLMLLASAVVEPERPLAELPLVADEELAELRQLGRGPWRALPDVDVRAMWERQVATRPDAVALSGPGRGPWSYAELDHLANRWAWALVARGVGHGEPVGVSLPRSPEMIAAILAIVKAGAAYLPLDPDYPDERLSYMLETAQARLVVAGDDQGRWEGAEVVRPAELDAEAQGQDGRAGPPVAIAGDDPLYVMYTSGSTGQPKGATISHKNVLRLVAGDDYCDFGPELVFLQLGPLAFDSSTLEIWSSLLHGGRLALMPPGPAALDEIGAAIRDEGVTIAWLTAPLFQLLVDHNLDDLRGMRDILTGGDVVSPPHVERARRELPGRVYNGYGPTEATVFTCLHRLAAPVRGPVPIGRPVTNTQVYLLDEARRPVPWGAPGELYVGGDGVGLGYANRPDLTAERFVESPFGDGILYKTGDIARLRRDGLFEFLGRRDQQVKVRGIRIELEEIEAALLELEDVVHASVVVRGQGHSKELAAYAVFAGLVPSADALRQALRERLPDHMIPQSYWLLSEMPWTTSGKVDRKRLHELARPLEGAAKSPPSGPTESGVAAVWAEVLDLEPELIGRDDDFFSLGGHSLAAMRVVSRVRERFSSELSLVDFFAQPSVGGLAALVDASSASGQAPGDDLDLAAERPVTLAEIEAMDEAAAEALLEQRFGE